MLGEQFAGSFENFVFQQQRIIGTAGQIGLYLVTGFLAVMALEQGVEPLLREGRGAGELNVFNGFERRAYVFIVGRLAQRAVQQAEGFFGPGLMGAPLWFQQFQKQFLACSFIGRAGVADEVELAAQLVPAEQDPRLPVQKLKLALCVFPEPDDLKRPAR